MALNFTKKIRVQDEDHSKRIQDALFDEGYTWSGNGRRVYQHTKEPALYAEEGTGGDKYALFGSIGTFFDECQAQEYFLTNDGKLVTESQVAPVAPKLRSKASVDSLHRDIDKERFMELHKAIGYAVETGDDNLYHGDYIEYASLATDLISFK